jgi:pimeloyl-ACP methyl ester carboxylesterase
LKKSVIILSVLAIILFILPFITGNIEVNELNDEARKGAPGSFIKLSGGVVHYELAGPDKGEIVVLIHGNAAPYFSWDKNIKALTGAGFRVLRYDLFGSGYSDRPDVKYTRDFYNNQLIELLDRLNVKEPFNLAGTSQGGSIAVFYAASNPGRVKRLALLSPYINILPMKAPLAILRTPVIGDYLASIALDKNNITYPKKVFADEKNITDEFLKQYHTQLSFKGFKQARLRNFRGNNLDDFTPEYETVAKSKIPVLLTWGSADTVIKSDSILNIKNAIPDVNYQEIKGGGHLVHYENPEPVNSALVNFFKK